MALDKLPEGSGWLMIQSGGDTGQEAKERAEALIEAVRSEGEQLRAMLAARVPEDDCQQIDTSALPVKHTSRVRGPDSWTGPGNDLAARFGRDAAHAEWFYGFRLAIKTDLGSRIVRAWSIVPAAVNERQVAVDLLEAGPAPPDLLADKGFNGKAFAAQLATQGTAVLVPPGKDQRAREWAEIPWPLVRRLPAGDQLARPRPEAARGRLRGAVGGAHRPENPAAADHQERRQQCHHGHQGDGHADR